MLHCFDYGAHVSFFIQDLAATIRASDFLLDILGFDSLTAAKTVVIYHVMLLAHRLFL